LKDWRVSNIAGTRRCPRSNDWKMCGKPPGAKHYFMASSRERP
jgi:hypothetical protein